jgi:hypothetical protein
MDARTDLLRLKQEALDASARCDGDFYAGYLTAGARAITPAGVAGRAEVVAAARSGGTWKGVLHQQTPLVSGVRDD